MSREFEPTLAEVVAFLDEVIAWWPRRPREVGMIGGSAHLQWARDVIAGDGPLVVIDPEDREQVKRLVTLFLAQFPASHLPEDDDSMQQALREFANPTPPKPDQPLGLGAVVEDADGLKWINVNQPAPMWVNQHDRTKWARYRDIAAVKVLSEGVTS